MSTKQIETIRKAVYYNVSGTPLRLYAEDIISDIITDFLNRDFIPNAISCYVRTIIKNPNSLLIYKNKFDYETTLDENLEVEDAEYSEYINEETIKNLKQEEIALLQDYFCNKSYRATGEIWNIDHKTVKRRVDKIINKISPQVTL